MLVNQTGQPLMSRQAKREMARDQQGQLVKIIDNLNQGVGAAHYRLDVFYEALKALGVTDEQFSEAQERVKARYQEEQKKEAIQ